MELNRRVLTMDTAGTIAGLSRDCDRAERFTKKLEKWARLLEKYNPDTDAMEAASKALYYAYDLCSKLDEAFYKYAEGMDATDEQEGRQVQHGTDGSGKGIQ